MIRSLHPPLVITGIYCAVAGLWIAASDQLLAVLFKDPHDLVSVSIYKGIAFVAVTGALLYGLLYRRELQHHAALDALAGSEARFRATFEQAAVGIAHVGLDGRWLRVNQKLCDFLGYPRTELMAMTFQDVTHPDDLGEDLALVAELRADPTRSYSLDKRYVTKSGRIVWANLTVALVTRRDGSPDYFISVIEDLSTRKRAEQALQEAMRRLTVLSTRLIDVQESERRSVARELHDDTGQSLTAIKIILQTITRQHPELDDVLHDAIGIAERSLTQVRELSRGLWPSQLDDLGLVPALNSMIQRLARHANMKISLDAPDALPDRIAPQTAATCFRVAQEALTNIVRHAGASEARVRLTADRDQLHLLVEDNGRGFPAVQALAEVGQTSLGLLGMLERAKLAGGELDIDSRPGAGTRITMRLPLKAAT